MKCDFCGSDKNKKIFDYARHQEAAILQCQKCNLVFLKNTNTELQVLEFYQNQYRNLATILSLPPDEHYHNPTVVYDANDRIKWIKRFVDLENIRVLEVGSASGRMLQALQNEGADAHGTEITQSYVEYSRNLGFTVYDRPITEYHFRNEFDLIISFHCIEHISQPKKTFQAIQKALKAEKQNLFMGEVPNQNDWRIQIFNSPTVKRFHYDPCHYYYYSPQTLSAYLKATGFEIEQLVSVERYNSLKQLKRILSEEFVSERINPSMLYRYRIKEILNQDVFACPNENDRFPRNYDTLSKLFKPILEVGINSKLMGNCLRWVSCKR